MSNKVLFFIAILIVIVSMNLPFAGAQDWGEDSFEKAKTAREDLTGNYQIATRLRLGDAAVLGNDDKIQGLKKSKKHYEEAMEYEKGIEEVDKELNDISYLLYIQSLIVHGENDRAIGVCDTDKIWDNHRPARDDTITIYLKGYALYKREEKTEAINLLEKISGYPLANYLLGKIFIEQRNYVEAKRQFEALIAANASIPKFIYLPFFEDGSILDDAQYLMGICYFNLKDPKKTLRAFAKVPRFYLNLDAGKLVNNYLNRIITYYNEGEIKRWDQENWSDQDWESLREITDELQKKYKNIVWM